MASLTAIYALTLVAASAAAMGGAVAIEKFHPAGSEPPPEKEEEEKLPLDIPDVVEPTAPSADEDEPQLEKQSAPSADEEVQLQNPTAPPEEGNPEPEPMTGGAIGRPPWQPYTNVGVTGSLINTADIVSTTGTSIEAQKQYTIRELQGEFIKVSNDISTTRAEVYKLQELFNSKIQELKEIKEGDSGTTGYNELSYTIEPSIKLKKWYETQLDKGPELEKIVKGDSRKKNEVLEGKILRKTGEDDESYRKRLFNIVKEKPDEYKEFWGAPDKKFIEKSDEPTNVNQWYNALKGQVLGGKDIKVAKTYTELKEEIEKTKNDFLSFMTTFGPSYNSYVEKKEQIERLETELKELKPQIEEKKNKLPLLNKTRTALLGQLNTVIEPVKKGFFTKSTPAVQPVLTTDELQTTVKALINKNNELSSLESQYNEFLSDEYIDLASKKVRTADEETALELLTKRKTVFETKKKLLESEVINLRYRLEGRKTEIQVQATAEEKNLTTALDTANPLPALVDALKAYKKPTKLFTNSGFTKAYNVYFELSNQPNSYSVLTNIQKYSKFFTGKLQYEGADVDKVFVYIDAQIKSENTNYPKLVEELKKFRDSNFKIAYEAYSKLLIAKFALSEKNVNLNSNFGDLEPAVNSLVKGETIAYRNFINVVKSVVNPFPSTTIELVQKTIQAFKRRIIDKLETAKIAHSAFGSKSDYKLDSVDTSGFKITKTDISDETIIFTYTGAFNDTFEVYMNEKKLTKITDYTFDNTSITILNLTPNTNYLFRIVNPETKLTIPVNITTLGDISVLVQNALDNPTTQNIVTADAELQKFPDSDTRKTTLLTTITSLKTKIEDIKETLDKIETATTLDTIKSELEQATTRINDNNPEFKQEHRDLLIKRATDLSTTATERLTATNPIEPIETPVPETTTPETPVPETTTPETPVPETPVPETTPPETTVPETENLKVLIIQDRSKPYDIDGNKLLLQGLSPNFANKEITEPVTKLSNILNISSGETYDIIILTKLSLIADAIQDKLKNALKSDGVLFIPELTSIESTRPDLYNKLITTLGKNFETLPTNENAWKLKTPTEGGYRNHHTLRTSHWRRSMPSRRKTYRTY